MFVKPKHKTLRDEVIESGLLGPKKWVELVDVKGRAYLASEKAKGMSSKGRGFAAGNKMEKGTPITLQHLFAIILYCDFSNLCTAFSETFRVENVFESVESVMSRHSAFAHFGKLLVELVLEFGSNGKNGESGPFFSGINRVLNIGSFAICLRGPCSTSTEMEVALNFAKEDGMILKLNNDSLSARYQCCFDCSWLSNYFEEAERLWIAGDEPLRIVTILVVQTAKNYNKMMRALFLFDAMISGVLLGEKIKPRSTDYELLSNLIELTLNGDIAASELDSYLKDEWNLFIQRKEEIILDLHALDKGFQSLSDLVMFNVRYNWSGKAVQKDNVPKPEWLSIFPSLCTVSILTDGKSYKFRLKALKEMVEGLSPLVSVKVFDMGHWAEKALSDDVVAEFGAFGWDIEYDGDLQMKGGVQGNMKGIVVKSKVR